MDLRAGISVLALVVPALAQTTWHVDVHATPPGNGTPGSPYASIQYAIAQATTTSGDLILVAPGTYAETIDYLGKTLVIRGSAGAAGTVIDGTGQLTDLVRVVSGEGPGTRLEGFTLKAVLPYFVADAGGLRCQSSSIEVRECTFSKLGVGPTQKGGGAAVYDGELELVRCRFVECHGTDAGGAVFAFNSDLRVDACAFTRCDVTYSFGGAIFASGCQVEIVRSSFHHNVVTEGIGGALYVSGGSARIADTLFRGNRALHSHNGGALAKDAGGTVVVERCRFLENAAAAGGAIASFGALTVRDSDFRRNQAGLEAQNVVAGSAIHSGSGALVQRSTFFGNTTVPGGFGSELGAVRGCVLERCTLVANQTTSGSFPGSAAAASSLRDCIVWGNLPTAGTVNSSVVTYSDVDVPIPGTGNISADPLFVSELTGDLRLLAGSPCIDAGDPASPPDPDGSRADMGAFPFYASYGPPPENECQGKIDSQGCVPYTGHNGAPASVGGGLFVVYGRNVRANTFGVLVWSLQGASIPFQGGVLCVGTPRWRTPLQSSGSVVPGATCSGEFAFAWTSAYLAASGLGAGTAVHCQFWGRDAADPYGSTLTDALEFQLVP